MKMDDKLSEVFDILPPEESGNAIIEVKDREVKSVDDDFEESRENLRDLLERGKDALEHAIELAKSGENASSFEVVGKMIKQLADINQQLLDLHIQKNKIKDSTKQEPSSGGFQQNNVFVGSTAELAKLVRDMKRGEN